MAGKAVNILVTGTNRGIGLEMVKQMAEKSCPGRKIFACCRNPDKAQALKELAKKHPGVILVIRMDITDHRSIKEAAKQVCSVLGKNGLNLLVNNAAVHANKNMQSAEVKEMQDAFNTNILGTMMVTKEFLPCLREAAKSSGKAGMSCSKAAVVNISTNLSSMSMVPEMFTLYPAMPYHITKAGLNMLTVCNSLEYKEDGILFSLIHPGWVRTDMGGEAAPIESPESVSGMLNVMDSLTEKHTGALLDYKGQPIPW